MKKLRLLTLIVVVSLLFGVITVNSALADRINNTDAISPVIIGTYTGNAGGGISILGQATETMAVATYGVYGQTASAAGAGVVGVAYETSNWWSKGVYGRSASTGGSGVYGYASASSGGTQGVYGLSKSTSGKGIYGEASAQSGTTFGMHAKSKSTAGRGIYGEATATSGSTYGVYGRSRSATGRGVYGYANASTGNNFGVYGRSESTTGKGVYGYAKKFGVYGKAPTGGFAVYADGRLHVKGNFSATGTKSAVVRLKNGEGITLYAEESSENWFVDYGFANLENGKAAVNIDPVFAQTVNTGMEYHVVLTPEGDCKGLYVTKKGESTFEVRELNRGKSNISFSYRIAAKRTGCEDQRLARVAKDTMTTMATAMVDIDHQAD